MKSRLDSVRDWETLAHQVRYSPLRLAEHCQMSLRQLERYCRERFGRSLRDYLKETALNHSKVLLRNGSSVKEVAWQVGYSAPEHFSRNFRQRHGVSPTEWRAGGRA